MIHSTSPRMPVTIQFAGQQMRRQSATPASIRTDRRGISLLEILFSVFILSVGLLGLASLIPAGTTDVAAANVADRSGNIGRAAFREVSVRNFTDFNSWRSPTSSDDRVNSSGGTVPPFVTQGWIDIDEPLSVDELPLASPVEEGHSICIDPMFIARSEAAWAANNQMADPDFLLPIFDSKALDTWPANPGGWPGRAFPYYLDNDPKPNLPESAIFQPMVIHASGNRVKGPPRMSRVTLRSWPSDLAPAMNIGLADRIFRWRDDLLFDLPPDDVLRPTATVDILQRGQSEGDYTWIVTLTPVPGEDAAAPNERTLYNCSVVVFHKRNLEMPVPAADAHTLSPDNFSWGLDQRGGLRPSERIVLADCLSAGVSQGGGDVRLRLVVTDDTVKIDPSQPEKNDFTNIRPGNWILLSGYRLTNPVVSTEHHADMQWFRVLAVGDGPTLLDPDDPDNPQPTPSTKREWVRDVTLIGPDWNSTKYFDVDDPDLSDGTPFGFATCYATLVEGVVAVFSKTIPVE